MCPVSFVYNSILKLPYITLPADPRLSCSLASLTMTALPQANSMINETAEKDDSTRNQNEKLGEALESVRDEGQDSSVVPEKLERWNHPRINMYRYLTTLLCFINMGMNDAAYGVGLSNQ